MQSLSEFKNGVDKSLCYIHVCIDNLSIENIVHAELFVDPSVVFGLVGYKLHLKCLTQCICIQQRCLVSN